MGHYVRIVDGCAQLSDEETCPSCEGQMPWSLTAEEAVIAAEELLMLAGKQWTGLRDVSPPQILTEQQSDAAFAVEMFACWSEPEGQMWPGFPAISGFPSDDKVPGFSCKLVMVDQ